MSAKGRVALFVHLFVIDYQSAAVLPQQSTKVQHIRDSGSRLMCSHLGSMFDPDNKQLQTNLR